MSFLNPTVQILGKLMTSDSLIFIVLVFKSGRLSNYLYHWTETANISTRVINGQWGSMERTYPALVKEPCVKIRFKNKTQNWGMGHYQMRYIPCFPFQTNFFFFFFWCQTGLAKGENFHPVLTSSLTWPQILVNVSILYLRLRVNNESEDMCGIGHWSKVSWFIIKIQEKISQKISKPIFWTC